MSSQISKLQHRQAVAIGPDRVWISEITKVTSDGLVYVARIDGEAGEVQVLLLSEAVSPRSARVGAEVLLCATGDRPDVPIVIGVIADRMETAPSSENQLELSFSDRRVSIKAEDSLKLDCGRSSILMQKDGRIVLRGTQITSRASATNRIKGATVKIN